jgi:hypothetical protein
MKCITFHSMNPIYGRERKLSKSTQNYNAKISFQMSMQSITYEMTILCVFFKDFNNI